MQALQSNAPTNTLFCVFIKEWLQLQGVFPPGSGKDCFQKESQQIGLALLGLQALIFCRFLCLNIVLALIAVVFSPPCSDCTIKELSLVVCRGDGEQWWMEDAVLVAALLVAAALRKPSLIVFPFILQEHPLM